MRAILTKDIYQLFTSCRLSLIFLLAFAALAGAYPNYFSLILAMGAGIFSTDLSAQDEKSGWERYSISLPYKRCDIVIEKYLIGTAICTLTSILFMIFSCIFAADININILKSTICVLSISLIMLCASLPFIFSLGYSKGIVIFIIAAVISVSAYLIARLYKNMNAEIVIGKFNNDNCGIYLAAAAICAAVLVPISAAAYSRRQFN